MLREHVHSNHDALRGHTPYGNFIGDIIEKIGWHSAATSRRLLPRAANWAVSTPSAAPRVLLVTPQPFFEERGTPIAVALTARALVDIGYLVDVLAFPVGENVTIPGVQIRRCGNPFGIRHVPIGFSLRKVLLDASLLKSFERLLAGHEYDVVHAVS